MEDLIEKYDRILKLIAIRERDFLDSFLHPSQTNDPHLFAGILQDLYLKKASLYFDIIKAAKPL